MKPDSEGAWICKRHELERGHTVYGSHCYRCLKENLDTANKEKERLRDKVGEGKKLLARCLARITFLEKRSGIATLEGDDLQKESLKDNETPQKEQYRPAVKCTTPHCENLIDTNYCPKCREDWAS